MASAETQRKWQSFGPALVAAVLWLFPPAIAAGEDVPRMTRESLQQAVQEAKQGNREQLSKMSRSLQRPEGQKLPKELLPEFTAMLKDDDTEIQLVGALGLRILKNPKSKDALVEYLKSKDFRKLDRLVREGKMDERAYTHELKASAAAVMTLGDVGDKSVVPLLESLSGVKDLKFEFGGGPVQEALAKLGVDGIESVSKLGPDADDRQLMAATQAIRGIRDPKKAPSLIATAKNEKCNIRIRAAAIGALANMKGDGVDTLPFVLSVIRDPNYPLDLRKWTVDDFGSTQHPGAEEALRGIMEDPACEFRSLCLRSLGRLNPGKYLPQMLNTISDKSAPLPDREMLAQGIFWIAERGQLKQQAEMLTDGIKAVMPDGTPADCVRVLMWKAYNKATQKEPRLEVKDEKKAYEVFRGYFHQAIIIERRYSDYDELCRRLDEKIKSIVVQWKPEKGEQGQ